VALRTLTAAVTLVDGSGKDTLDGIDVSWASGKEPQAVTQAREAEQAASKQNGHSVFSSTKRGSEPTPEPAMTSYKVPKLDESDILSKMRARERERERLEEQIRQQDAEAEAQGQE